MHMLTPPKQSRVTLGLKVYTTRTLQRLLVNVNVVLKVNSHWTRRRKFLAQIRRTGIREHDNQSEHSHQTRHVLTSISLCRRVMYRLQTTIDFLIHLSYKTGHFGGLYKIPWSSNSKINHFIWIIMINSHCKKNMNIGSSLNFWELGPFLRGTLSSATCRTIGTIKTYFILSLNDNIISHQE